MKSTILRILRAACYLAAVVFLLGLLFYAVTDPGSLLLGPLYFASIPGLFALTGLVLLIDLAWRRYRGINSEEPLDAELARQGKLLWYLLPRLICYFVAAVVAGAFIAVWLLGETGACTAMNEAYTTCGSAWAKSVADASIGILLFTFFLGLPLPFILGAAIFFIYDMFQLLRRRSGRMPT